MSAFLARNRAPLYAFAIALAVYAIVTGPRMLRQSSDPHFATQAAAWLDGRVDLESWKGDDPAKVDEVRLADGTLARGRFLTSRKTFRRFGGDEVPTAGVTKLRTLHYVSFPPFPSVLLLPQAMIPGARANDVVPTLLLAALAPALLLVLLRRLREVGLSARTPCEDAWLAALLAFGTVFFFSAVQGRVWFTAHIVGVVLALGYAWASIEAAHPVVAGLALALATVTRTPMLFMFPFFVLEALRVSRIHAHTPNDRRAWLTRRALCFALPLVLVGLAAAWYNHARFGEFAEFGHSYLAVRQQAQIEQHGLFDLHYLGRNLAVLLTLLPEFSLAPPFISISGHGLALWLTTPAFLLLLWPRERGPLFRTLWLTILGVAVWSLTYQNSGWVQFGYRFSLDYTVFLVLLLATSGPPLGRVAKTLIVAGIVVNLFGAVTFARHEQFYRWRQPPDYGCVVPN